MTPCSWVKTERRIRGTCFVLVSWLGYLSTVKMEAFVLPKCQLTYTGSWDPRTLHNHYFENLKPKHHIKYSSN
jgi:hypothetical protein